MVAPIRTGRSVESLARAYELCAATIHEWVRHAAADGGDDPGHLTIEEPEELRLLRREAKQLRQERDILSMAAAWFAQDDVTSRRSSNS